MLMVHVSPVHGQLNLNLQQEVLLIAARIFKLASFLYIVFGQRFHLAKKKRNMQLKAGFISLDRRYVKKIQFF